MNTYIGIDLGTSSVKLLLVAADGTILNTVTQTYNVYYPKDGWSEQNPEDWYSGVIGGIIRLLVGQDKSAVKGIGLGGQMHGLVNRLFKRGYRKAEAFKAYCKYRVCGLYCAENTLGEGKRARKL